MREVLFRGKRIVNGNWIEGYYSKGFLFPEEETLRDFIYTFSEESGKWEFDYAIVDLETVGQYTGLCDKNGKKIFEGDILDCGDRITYVSWHEGCGTWDCKFVRYKGKLCSNGIENAEWKYRATVIGNIHDNPEMLGGWR